MKKEHMNTIRKGLGSLEDYGGRSIVLRRRVPQRSWGVISINFVKDIRHKI